MHVSFTTVCRVLVPLGAVAALAGCPNPQTYGTPRTLAPGKITHTIAAEAWNYSYEDAAGNNFKGTLPVMPTYQMRVGVADSIDVGIRLPNLASLGADVKYNLIRGKQFDFAIMPSLQWFQTSAKVDADSDAPKISVYYLHLPVLLGLNLGESATLVLSPGVTYTAVSSSASTSEGTSAAATSKGTWARFGIGLNWRVGRRFALHPEVTVMRNFGDQKTMMAFMGLGFNFGSMPNYMDGASGEQR